MNVYPLILTAYKNLKLNPLRSFLTMIGIIIGIFSVAALISIGEGARKYILDQFYSLGTNILVVTPGGSTSTGMPYFSDSTHKLTIEDCESIRTKCPSVKYVAPLIFASAPIKYETKIRNNTAIAGTTYEYQHIRTWYAQIGSFIPEEDILIEKNVCVIGVDLVEEIFGNESTALGKSLKIGGRSFKVIGIMQEKGSLMSFDLDKVVFIPLKTADDLFDTGGELYQIILSAPSYDNIERAKEEVRTLLIKRHGMHEDFSILDQGEMAQSLDNILNMLTYAIAGIAAISLLVGGIGIMNIMLVAVSERLREIGIRKAVGARNLDVLIQFLIESCTLSFLGGLFAIMLIFIVIYILKIFIPALPILIKPWSVIIALTFSIAVGIFFGIYPAKKAANLSPVDALRYE